VPETPKDRPVVIVSSTARDLPAHRKEVEDACLRQGMFPVMMERLPASDAEAISASLRMVDEADIYVGVFAHRYGYVPKEGNPRQISVTEMEYGRAVERNIPRQIFIIDKKHPLGDFTIDDIDKGESAEKLAKFKAGVEAENIVNYFNSPADLRAHVINSLSQLRKPDLTKFHYVSDIPAPPEPFIAHPYTLLQTHRLVGRQPELNLLTDWVARPDADVYKAHILNVVAVGGMGKSALTWKWFNDIAPQEMSPLAGRLWWSFYESDATFENFVTRALAYTTRSSLAEVQQIPAPDRESQLLHALDHEPFLLVLDGLERIIIAYARMDAARREESQVSTQRNIRKTADPRAGRFLKKLAQVRNSRILISTRLYPAELEIEGGDPIPNSFRLNIIGLLDEDAMELWRALKVTGSRDLLLPIFTTFGKHPLLIQALAGEVKSYRRAPGDFERWRKANPKFDPTKFPRIQDVMNHVMEFALRWLDSKARKVLQVIAAFRMPTTYDALTAILVGKARTNFDLRTGKLVIKEGKLFDEEIGMDVALTELEDRGLVGWDKRANRYDLHPIVRGVVWGSLKSHTKHELYESLLAYFESVTSNKDWHQVTCIEEISLTIELYNTLVGLGRYEDALQVFHVQLHRPLLFRLGAMQQSNELLDLLLTNGPERSPRHRDLEGRLYILNGIALGHTYGGEPGKAIPLFRRVINEWEGRFDDSGGGFVNLAEALLFTGALREAQTVLRYALSLAQEQRCLHIEYLALSYLGRVLAICGLLDDSAIALQRALRMLRKVKGLPQSEGLLIAFLTQLAIWMENISDAASLVEEAWELAQPERFERDFIRSKRLRGFVALKQSAFGVAEESLIYALTRSRAVNSVDEELQSLTGIAELRRRQGDLRAVRELLEDVWEAAERGPYPLFHADACCVLAEVERDEGNREKAIEAARKAYRLAWCDGPPFAYHWGLERARALLKELGAGEPEMPAFDASRFEAMPEVEIDPADEFGVESKSEG
jgi:tetratricopeptide (TPR) repeat protein